MAAAAHGMTDDEYNALTDAERAGLEEDLGDGDNGINADDDKDHDNDPESKAKGNDGDDDGAGRDDGGNAEAPAVPEKVEVPLIRGEDLEQIQDRLTAIKAEQDALETQFEDGDITSKEFRAGLDKLNKEANDLQWKVNKTELANEITEQQKMQAWYSDVGSYLAANPELKASELRLKAFDTVVRQVTADPETAKLSNREQLAKAHEIWARELGQPAPKAKGQPAPKPAAEPEAKRFNDRNVPPTLGRIPASAATDTDDGKYGYLDRLASTDPLKFEAELGRLSEAEQNAYLAS